MKSFKIGVLSDTHMPKKAPTLPSEIIEAFQHVDLILHVGDFTTDWVYYELQELANVEGIAGNNDNEYITQLLGRKKVLEIEGYRFGLVHGDGNKKTIENAREAFKDEAVDCIIFGHSHVPFHEVIEGVLYFNPGSPTDKRRQERFSFGIITITEAGISAEIRYFGSAK